MARRRAGSWWQLLMLWSCTFLGGAVAGMGAFLLIQVRVVRSIRQQVDDLSGVERFFGKMTFLWRDADEKVFLALSEIPEEYLGHSWEAAHWLLGFGIAGIALAVPWYLKRRWR